MCGIFGLSLNRKLTDNDINNANKCLDSINYRGPDFTGSWYNKEKGIFLGHNRLSILDVSKKSNQPFIDDNSVLVFNGEVYNYKDIKSNKLHTLNFKTSSDTEVLSKYLNKLNTKFLNELDGMFAFCFYKNDTLTISNDIFSEKTIYYALNEDGVYFCSEAGPLIKLLKLKISCDPVLKEQFMSLGYVIPPNTGFKDLYITSQASFIKIRRGKIIHNSNYYKFPKLKQYKGKIKYINEIDVKKIKNLLIETIESRMQTDVDMGIFLSGGNDSSLIASIMSKELNIKPLAITMSYETDTFNNEAKVAKEICKYLKIEHISYKNNMHNPSESILDDTIALYNDLNDNTSYLLIQKLSEFAKKYFKVAITGLGGDEMFYGYGKHEFFYKYNKLLNSKYLNFCLSKIKSPSFFSNKIKLAINLSKHAYYNKILALNNNPFFDKKNLDEKFYKFNENMDSNQNMFESFRNFSLMYNLPNSIIQSNEKASMRSSIELRSPLLSKNIIEKISDFDYRSLMLSGRKGILKRILKDYLPDNLIQKNKQGFILPLENVITKKLINDYGFQHLNKRIKSDRNWKKLATRKIIFNKMKKMY